MSKPGVDFEKAVYAFADALNPNAEVLFDHKVEDRDTGTLRQCDVWINTHIGGHWPISILVSCKDHNRKLDIGDIGTFCNEVDSTGASTGVIYSRVGFFKPAIEKAKSNGIACCRLYQNEPSDMPSSFWFKHFACYLSLKLKLKTDLHGTKFKFWNDLFDLKIDNDETTLLDIISDVFIEDSDQVVEEFMKLSQKKSGSLPKDWDTEISIKLDQLEEKLRIQIWGHWKLYSARLEASLLKGSYCLTNDSFKGEIRGPYLDVKGSHPGSQWEDMTDEDFAPPSTMILAILHHPTGVKEQLRAELGQKALFG